MRLLSACHILRDRFFASHRPWVVHSWQADCAVKKKALATELRPEPVGSAVGMSCMLEVSEENERCPFALNRPLKLDLSRISDLRAQQSSTNGGWLCLVKRSRSSIRDYSSQTWY